MITSISLVWRVVTSAKTRQAPPTTRTLIGSGPGKVATRASSSSSSKTSNSSLVIFCHPSVSARPLNQEQWVPTGHIPIQRQQKPHLPSHGTRKGAKIPVVFMAGLRNKENNGQKQEEKKWVLLRL